MRPPKNKLLLATAATEQHNYLHLFIFCTDLSSLQRAIESESFKVSIPEDACVIDFTVFMTRYIIRAIIPYECLPIEKIAEELENSVWYTIGAGVSVMQIFLSQSSEKVRAAIVQEVSCLPQICKAVHVALQAGFVADQTGEKGSGYLTIPLGLGV